MRSSGGERRGEDRGFDLRYRPHIDGLRALAVLGVVVFHFQPRWVPGGFVGVDVFFVISGFLVSKSLYGALDLGTFTLANFYQRRARRIIPAFTVVTLGVIAASCAMLAPTQLLAFSRSVIASCLFASNIYFYHIQGYFSPGVIDAPLLHYWSLGVEEQFYIAFPLLLLAIRRLPADVRTVVVVALAVVSLAACVVVMKQDVDAAFYLLPFRGFELLIGSAIALPAFFCPEEPRACAVLGAAGLGLVVASLWLITPEAPFPGLLALPPCLGTAALLVAGEKARPAPLRLLEARPLPYLGRISFSLYLVHWPVAVFGRILFGGLHPVAFVAGGTAVSIAGAGLLYRFVERPFRVRRGAPPRRAALVATGAALAGLGSLAGVAIAADGFPGRLDAESLRLLAYVDYDYKPMFREGRCFLAPDQKAADFAASDCVPERRPEVVLWGSSHLAHLAFGLGPLLAQRGYALGQMTASSCDALLGAAFVNRPNCSGFNDFAADLLTRRRPEVVVIGGEEIGDEEVDPATFGLHLDQTIARLTAAGIRVVLLGPFPIFRDFAPKLLQRRLVVGDRSRLSDGDLYPESLASDATLAEQYGHRPDVTYVSVLGTMCPAASCELIRDGVPIYFDDTHLTREGSAYYASRLVDDILPPAGAP